jgi:hypothetical protein
VTLAKPGDPSNDATKVWPADREHVDIGTLIVRQAEDEANGPCRDYNYDPTILPVGIEVSDDPLLPARSSAYAKSFDLRTAEDADYPRIPSLPFQEWRGPYAQPATSHNPPDSALHPVVTRFLHPIALPPLAWRIVCLMIASPVGDRLGSMPLADKARECRRRRPSYRIRSAWVRRLGLIVVAPRTPRMYRMDLRTASKTAPWPALADLVADHLRAGAVDRGQLDHEEAPVGASTDADPRTSKGQRSCAPHRKAGHMNAPDQIVKAPQTPLAQRGPSTHTNHAQ